MSSPIYAIGDIHGQLAFLEQALAWIEADGGPDAEIVFLGDLVDRGPESRAVIERLIAGQAAGRRWTVVKGNHDRMFSRFLSDGTLHDDQVKSGIGWLHPRLGGAATLASYGVTEAETRPFAEVLEQARQAVPATHRNFLETLPVYEERAELLFVHAGIRPGVALAEQAEDDLVWIRTGFLDDTRPHPWLVVHGHTALDVPCHHGNRVNLDGGAGYGRPIYPAVFEGREVWLLDEGGRMSLG
ncbi:metallophosphoesterase family protein [Pseudooceanicola sp.]|uniref:metallophosphoesterase family protein n=1 Tax=Pseudooceanicola sp. TaxID=1914328 RepID=UPI003510E06B